MAYNSNYGNPYMNDYPQMMEDDVPYQPDLPLQAATVQRPTVSPSDIQQAVASHAEKQQLSNVVSTQQNTQPTEYPTVGDNKYTRFALQLQQRQAQSGIDIPFSAPTKMSTLEDMAFSALGAYAVMKLLGAHSNKAWGIGLNAGLHAMDSDNQMAERYPAIQQMLKQGYSWPAVMEWYRTGKTDAIEKEQTNLLNLKNNREARAEARYEADANRQVAANQNRMTNITNQGKYAADALHNGVNLNYNGGENSLGSADAFEQYVRQHEGGKQGQEDYLKSGHYGTHQQSQQFYSENGGQGDVRNATPEQEAATTRNFYNKMRTAHPDWTDAMIASAYHDGETGTANAIAEGKSTGTPWYTHLGTQGKNYVSDLTNGYTVSQNGNYNQGNSGQITYTDENGITQTVNVATDKYGAPKLQGSDKDGHYYVTTSGKHIPYNSVVGSSNSKIQIAGQTADTILQDLNAGLGEHQYGGHSATSGQWWNAATNFFTGNEAAAQSTYDRINNGMEANMADRAVASAGGSAVLKADMQAQVKSAGKLSTDQSDAVNRQVIDNWLNILARSVFNTMYYNQYGKYPSPSESKQGASKLIPAIENQYPNIANAFTGNNEKVDMGNMNSDSNVQRDANGNIVGSSTGMSFTRH